MLHEYPDLTCLKAMVATHPFQYCNAQQLPRGYKSQQPDPTLFLLDLCAKSTNKAYWDLQSSLVVVRRSETREGVL